MVDGETYGCVKSFCYLGDTLDGDGGEEVLKTTAYNRWNCQVIRPANCCHIIPSNSFLDGFPDPSQFAAAKLTHYSTIPHRPSDSSRPRQCLLLSGDVHQNPGPAAKYPCSVCTSNVTSRE